MADPIPPLLRPSRLAPLLAVAVALVVAAAGPAPAEAAVNCSFNGGALTIQSTAEHDEARITRSGNDIVVSKGTTPVSCGTQATVFNTHVIAHQDASPGEAYFTVDLRGGPFSPGSVDEPGNSDEIDIQAIMGAGDDRLYVWGGPGADFWRLGQTANGAGLNLNADADGTSPNSDVDFRDVQLAVLLSGPGDDRVIASGGPEFTGPLPIRADVNGDTGDDEIATGSGADHITDGDGNDVVSGGANDDNIIEWGPVNGDDSFDGGPGDDGIGWADFNGDMRVDLRLTGRQDTGAGGRDAVTRFESAFTAAGNDVLIGTDANERLSTGDGDDLIAGLGGNDWISAGDGNDTASYATPPAGVTQGVTVDLSLVDVNQNTVGAGIDRLEGVANLIGSPFADVLSGSAGANRFEVRDGASDVVNCSGGADTAIADVEGTDDIADCEAVELDVRPDTKIESAPASLSNDTTPAFGFSATKQGSTFECSLDGSEFAPCGAAFAPGAVSDGAHSLRVRARDLLGARDLSPAEHAFSVDATAPRIARARMARGRRLAYRLSEKATVRIAIERCTRVRGKRCKRFKKAAAITRSGATGANVARLRKVRTRGGHVRVTLRATDAAGNVSKRLRVRAR
jgi:hemolysin type calcium-binding protein